MSALPWKPWHEVVKLRDDLRSGELSLATFAADLYDVVMGKGRPVYRDPKEFFALTYPTSALRELVSDVVLRLAGKNDKAVRQLQLTYGGGKTHTLITFYHLVNEPATLPDLPAVAEFKAQIGMTPPRARVAALCFDKLDVEKGMEVKAPNGETRWLKHPWSVLAFQLGGGEGLRLLSAEGTEAERESAPAENLLAELLSLPTKDGLATLVLVDEVLMYAREKVGLDPGWQSRIGNFFQYLTQAATKVDRCAIVASLLATDPAKNDATGKEIIADLHAIFRRQQEEGVEPVGRDDVAEVLRRRFFKPESIRDKESFRPHVHAALAGIESLDEQSRRDRAGAEERFVKSYPFHPDLTDVFYQKWTQLESFQRTRGILRTFAIALRDAERWDQSPLVSSNVFLAAPGQTAISEAARELTTVAATEEYEGKRQEWGGVLAGELEKARIIQDELGSLRHRELEQAVFATFVHSQPIGQDAKLRELLVLTGATRPSRIDFEKALLRWADESWFLDEEAIADAGTGPSGERLVPRTWRLGSKPNLKQMHSDACSRISGPTIDSRLLSDIPTVKSLTAGASAAGAKVHMLPERPRDIEDDGEFRFALLGPRAASEPGKPSAEAIRFLNETTGPDRPRTARNAVVLVVPSTDGLEAARNAVREYLGWEEVQNALKGQEIDPVRSGTLKAKLDEARRRLPDAIRQAYSIVVTVGKDNSVDAFKVTLGTDPLFVTVKADSRSRIQETAVTPEALLPDGPYDLWRPGEESQRLKTLVGAFAERPHLPKMLSRKAILDTLVTGCREGTFVLRLTRPDKSVRTFWREAPDDAALKEPSLEVVLPGKARLSHVDPAVLARGQLPELWESGTVRFGDLTAYFAGGKVVKARRNGYDEPIEIPAADPEVLAQAVTAAVQDSILWFRSGPASLLGEAIPAGLLTSDSELAPPPEPISPLELLKERLPAVWAADTASAYAISIGISKERDVNLPWPLVRDAIDGAIRARYLERTEDSGPWPCDVSGAHLVKLRHPAEKPPTPPQPPLPLGARSGQADLRPNQLQDLADAIGKILSQAAGYDLKFTVRLQVGGGEGEVPVSVVDAINAVLRGIDPNFEIK
jgi:hypothetical protein